MPRRTDSRQLAAFLNTLRASRNLRWSATAAGLAISGIHKRRRRDPDFARQVDEALSRPADEVEPSTIPPAVLTRVRGGASNRQLRAVRSGQIDAAAERTFLVTLAATGNVRLSARAAGFAHSSFYRRARVDRPFALAMEEALDQAISRIEADLLQAAIAGLDPVFAAEAGELAIPPLGFDAAMHLLQFHHGTRRAAPGARRIKGALYGRPNDPHPSDEETKKRWQQMLLKFRDEGGR